MSEIRIKVARQKTVSLVN